MDRLAFNIDGKTLDEMVLSNAFVHLEQLSDNIFMLIAVNTKHHWHLTISSRNGRSFVDAKVFEDYVPDKKEVSDLAPKLEPISEQEIGKILNNLAYEQLNLAPYKRLSTIQNKWLAGERIRDAQLASDRKRVGQ